MAFTPTTLELPSTMPPAAAAAAATRHRHARPAGHLRCAADAVSTAPAERTAARVIATSSRTASASAASGSVARVWRKVQGSGDWDGMLSPLHPVLRGEVARYGELVGACYAALEEDPSSPRYMNCKYGKLRMLEDAGVAGAGYEVTRYIYSSPDAAVPGMEASTSGRASWVGYVAVSTDETTRRLGRRDVLVSFRGTVTPAEWMANLRSSLELALDFVNLGDLASVHDLGSYVASLREEVVTDAEAATGGVLAMAMELVGRQWQSKDAARGMVQSTGLI
uniref:Phospholipase A1 n=1 Tax=Oryza barthii TaxID=65489 RepID=A0A0D3EXG0_9ORYZ